MKCHFFQCIVQTPLLCSLVLLFASHRFWELFSLFHSLTLSVCMSVCLLRIAWIVYVFGDFHSLYQFVWFFFFSEIANPVSIFFSHSLLLFKHTTISLILVCIFFYKKKIISVFSRKPIFVIVSFVFFFTSFFSIFFSCVPRFFFQWSFNSNENFLFHFFCSCHFQPYFHSHWSCVSGIAMLFSWIKNK